jgi:CRISPR-associated protein Cas5d
VGFSAFVRLKVSGDYALFTRADAKVERVSYETPTPSAARNILDSILFKPQMRWIVTSIAVLNPIRFQGLRRNELQTKLAPAAVRRWMVDPGQYRPQPAGAGSDDGTPRHSLLLRDVAYIIEAYPHVYRTTSEDTPVKYMAMFNRRVEKGQCFAPAYLGCREFAARCELPDGSEKPIPVSQPLGLMLYDIVFAARGTRNRAVFFDARLENGVLDTRPEFAIPDAALRQELLSCSQPL